MIVASEYLFKYSVQVAVVFVSNITISPTKMKILVLMLVCLAKFLFFKFSFPLCSPQNCCDSLLFTDLFEISYLYFEKWEDNSILYLML